MKFYRLNKSVSNQVSQDTIDKVEYFWHYWDFLFTENRDLILVNEPKFCSQISLINKIEKHLEWNNGFSANKLVKYFNQHIYFSKGNLILRGTPELLIQVQKIKTFIESCQNDLEEPTYLKIKDREHLLNTFSSLKNRYFELNSYSNVLINKLVKTITNNKKLNEGNKKDLKFLCNSIIDILVLRGYSLNFIKGLLTNKILSSSNKFSFKYEKRYIDFNSYDEWRSYATEQFKQLNLIDRLGYIKYFLNKNKDDGYYIFKVEGIKFESEPIEIFGVKFYNPMINKFLTFYDNKSIKETINWPKYVERTELFFSDKYLNSDNPSNEKASSCNLIVRAKYFEEDIEGLNSFKYPTKSWIESYNKAQIAFLEFKRYLRTYSEEYINEDYYSNPRVSKESVLTDNKFNYHSATSGEPKNEIIFKTEGIRREMMYEGLDFKKNITLEGIFLNHLANSNTLISEYKIESSKFNFKSLWIECFEPYFKDTEEIIKYAKKCIRIRTNLFSNYRWLLTNSFNTNPFVQRHTYGLTEESANYLGIGRLEVGDKVDGTKLEEKFELLPENSLLLEFKNEMNIYKNDKSIFFEKIDKWISNTINVAYDERNIEIHYNIVDFYNDISIKKDILFISSSIIGAFNYVIYKSSLERVDDVKKHIDKMLDDLGKNKNMIN